MTCLVIAYRKSTLTCKNKWDDIRVREGQKQYAWIQGEQFRWYTIASAALFIFISYDPFSTSLPYLLKQI